MVEKGCSLPINKLIKYTSQKNSVFSARPGNAGRAGVFSVVNELFEARITLKGETQAIIQLDR